MKTVSADTLDSSHFVEQGVKEVDSETSPTRRRYGWSNPEMRIYIFPNKSERDEWVAKDSDSREELPANTFIADMRLYSVHHGVKVANDCFVSPNSPLKFEG